MLIYREGLGFVQKIEIPLFYVALFFYAIPKQTNVLFLASLIINWIFLLIFLIYSPSHLKDEWEFTCLKMLTKPWPS